MKTTLALGKPQQPSPKRAQIVQTAEKLFFRFGAKRITVEEICDKAHVSKMTFYKYFANKKALVEAIRDELIDQGFRKFDEINALDLPYPEKIDLMTRWEVEFNTRINSEFIREILSTRSKELVERFKRGYLGNITAAQRKGEMRSDIEPEFIWLIQRKLGELFREESWKHIDLSFSSFQQQLRTLVYYGLLTRREGR